MTAQPDHFATQAEKSSEQHYTQQQQVGAQAAGQQQQQQPVAPPPAANCDRTAIIFDWDDTLLASSWLTSEGLRLDEPLEIPRHAVAQLQDLEEACIKLLSHAFELGAVTIVTNAETGWVELSAQRFMPRVLPLLSRCRVISARSTFEVAYPDQPNEWKVQAFRCAIADSFSPARRRQLGFGHAGDAMEVETKEGDKNGAAAFKNVLSFGDSIHERDAVHRVAGAMPRTWSKSVKFVERPTIEQLKRQVELVSSCFDYICGHGGDLDLMLTIQLLYN